MLRAIKSPKPVILTFVRYYLPGYKSGGPVRTIANMVAALGDEFDFRIVTSDRDATDTAPYAHLDSRNTWHRVGKAKVLYLSPPQQTLWNIARIIRGTPHDTLYLNSFFDPVFTQRPLLARRLGLAPKGRCVLAPRGEFSEGALALKSAKKRAFLAAARAASLYRGLEWQASSQYEEVDIRRTLGPLAGRIRIAANLPDMTARQLPPFIPRAPGQPLRVVFLSRISPKKNLDFALDVLRRVRVQTRFDIYGTLGDEKYWQHCQEIITTLPNNVEAAWRGSIPHAKVAETLARYDLFFLPTRGENYGHAIVEALCVGVPVLISNHTPWRNLEHEGAGWDLPIDSVDTFAKQIDRFASMSEDAQRRMRDQVRSLAHRLLNSNRALLETKLLFACSGT